MSNNHETPLYNLNIERAILSSAIFDIKIFEDISFALESDDFYFPFHQSVFKTMEKLVKEEKPLDDDFIKNEMIRSGQSFDEMAMIELLSANPISNYKSYFAEIKGFSQKRKLMQLGLGICQNLKEHKSSDELLEMIQEKTDEIEGDSFELGYHYASEPFDGKLPQFYLKDWLPIPSCALTLASADGGVGKTWLAIQMAIRFVVEENFEKKAFLWLSEDPESIIRDRIKDIVSFLGYSSFYKKIVNCIAFTTKEPPSLVIKKGFKESAISNKFYKIKKQLKPFDLIVFDPLSSFIGADENDNSEASTFMKPFKSWATLDNKSIIFLHHHNKNSGTFRGATTFRTSVRIAYEMDFVREFKSELNKKKMHLRSIKLSKDNWGGGVYIQTSVGGYIERQIVPIDKDFQMLSETKVLEKIAI